MCVGACACSGFPLNKQVLKARRLPQLKTVPITISGTWGPESLLVCLRESTIGQDDTPSQQRRVYGCTFMPYKRHGNFGKRLKHVGNTYLPACVVSSVALFHLGLTEVWR